MSRRDRFNLPPPPRGVLRGIVRNIRRSHVEAAYGPMEIIDFDLVVDEHAPPVPVQLRGNDFSRPLFEEWVADVADPDPSARPILTRRVKFPPHENADLISYFPGQDDPDPRRDRLWSVAMVAGPAILTILVAWYLVWHFGWSG